MSNEVEEKQQTKFYHEKDGKGTICIFEAVPDPETETLRLQRFICEVSEQETEVDTALLATFLIESFSTVQTLKELLPPDMRTAGASYYKLAENNTVDIFEGTQEGNVRNIKRWICKVSDQEVLRDKAMLVYGILAAIDSERTLHETNPLKR